jgi:putative endonuclease
MYYFYILECKDGKRYYGYTNDLKRRLSGHRLGINISTKHRRPVKLVYYEVSNSKVEVMQRERQFKSGKTRKTTIEKLIKDFPIKLLKLYE